MGSLTAAAAAAWISDAVDDLAAPFLITDPLAPNNPVVFASRAFLALSGYAAAEVLGRNARIFQGPATDRRAVMQIREAIRDERELQLTILNYRRDGDPHWILFHMCPVFAAADGRVVHFVAVQLPIPCRGGRRPVRTPATCRDEVRGDECDRASVSPEAENPGVQVEECREAGDWEKQKAASAAAEIVSALARYSKFTGRMVCGKRTDPHLPDMPIVYASEAFLSLTGYSSHEVLGRNCRFLNGPNTDAKVLYQIRNNIESQQAGTVRLLNYRKDGSSFWNLLHISPVRNASGKIAFYVGVQMDEGSEQDGHGLSLEMRQLGAVGAVKVAVRSLFARVGPSRLP